MQMDDTLNGSCTVITYGARCPVTSHHCSSALNCWHDRMDEAMFEIRRRHLCGWIMRKQMPSLNFL
jgi:hypothetical protein